MNANLETIARRLQELPDLERNEALEAALRITASYKWTPLPGPQTEAYFCPADVLYYGGQGGGGKSDLLLGLGFTAHSRSLIVRRQYTDLSALIDRALEINGSRKGYNGSTPPRLTIDESRLIDFGAAAKPGDEQAWQGRPHDLLGIEEAAQFHESQVRYLMGWVRSVIPGQRKRIVLASNPPLTAEGEWLTRMFAPWLDKNHPRPAKPGELRWFITDKNGEDQEVDGPEPVEIDGESYEPMSRTFIPSALADNPYLLAAGYKRTLDALPEPLRSAIRDGSFEAMSEDDNFQIIPGEWIRAAQSRWTPNPPAGVRMTALACDPAQGGRDNTVLAMRYGPWIAPLKVVPGRETPLGSDVAALVLANRRHACPVIMDLGGGYGSGPFELLHGNQVTVIGFKGAERAMGTTKDKKMGFANKRSWGWWNVRELLDPDQPGGSAIILPPDTTLLHDLASVRFSTTTIAGRPQMLCCFFCNVGVG